MKPERIVPTNLSLCDCLFQDINPEDFGEHKLNYVIIRATKDTRNKIKKELFVLPNCFNGRTNKGKSKITKAYGYNNESINQFNNKVIPEQKQAITIDNKISYQTERHVIYLFQKNELIQDLKKFLSTKFPTSDIYLQGFQSQIPNNGLLPGEDEIINQTWKRQRIVNKGSIYGIRLFQINNINIQDNIEYFSNSELRNVAGVFGHGGLMEDVCKIGPKDNGIRCTI